GQFAPDLIKVVVALLLHPFCYAVLDGGNSFYAVFVFMQVGLSSLSSSWVMSLNLVRVNIKNFLPNIFQ
ncbi:MAG: hypothetical protein PHE51_11755, partial [Eubacteriales bacterium]|nr:hypothetical protein [Eubacteriales bacterium]